MLNNSVKNGLNGTYKTIFCLENISQGDWVTNFATSSSPKIFKVDAILHFPTLTSGAPEENPIYKIEKVLVLSEVVSD